MRQVDPALAAALESPERTVRVRLSCDWDGDGHGPAGSLDDLSNKVASVTVSSALQGTQPDQANVVEGSATATITADLVRGDTDDERLQAVRYFSPFAASSPLAGRQRLNRDLECDVEFVTEAGPQRVPLLRGVSRALPAAVASRKATLTGLDYRSRLRTPVQLPAMAADVPDVGNLFPSKPGLEATWVVSYVLWQCGYPLAPPPRSTCRYYGPMHGSARAFVGPSFEGAPFSVFYNTGIGIAHSGRECRFATGPFVLGTEATRSGWLHWMIDGLADGVEFADSDGRTTGRMEWWIGPGLTSSGSSIDLTNFDQTVLVSAGMGTVINSEITNGGVTRVVTSTITPPIDGAWHAVGIHWDDAAGYAIFRVDNQTETVAFTPTPPATPGTLAWQLNIFAEGPAAEFHVDAGIAATQEWHPLTYVPTAVVDRSANRLAGIVPGEAVEGWQILQELAAAEQAAVFLDADGRPHYASRARLVSDAAQVVQRTIDATEHMFELAYDFALDRVFNIVAAPYQAIRILVQAEAWKLGETLPVPAAGTLTLVATYPGLATGARVLFGHANGAADGTGTEYVISPLSSSAAIRSTIEYVSDTHAVITITNTTGQRVWLVHTDGQPDLTLTGDLIAQGAGDDPAVVVDEASRAAYGDQPLTMPDNRWVQTRSFAWGMAMVTAGDLAQPQAVFGDLPIPGDPRLEYFDRVTARDPGNTELSADLWVVGKKHQIEATGEYTTTLAARPARDRYLAGSGLVGVDLVG